MSYLDQLNPQQREAVVTHQGPVLILAGAGTGKTRVITHRIAHMIARGIPPDKILAVTFTNKAAKEMLSRVNELVPKWKSETGEKPPRPTLGTFHSVCVRILRQHIEKLGYKRNFTIYDDSDQLGAVRKILSSISQTGTNSDPRAILSLISKFKNGGSSSALKENPELVALAEHVTKRYESALRACNAVDFDDLILLAIRLFKENPEALESCRTRWPYVMVDEYQDTNAAQFALVHALTLESRNLCVVGDDDQSIYGWRGADVANLLDLEKHFPEVKIVKLEQNYRSTNTILKAANAVIKNNTRRRGKSLWSDNGDGSKIQLQCFDSDEDEAKALVENIEYDRLTSRIPLSDQAVLFRTNQQSRSIEIALRQARMAYHVVGGQSFFDRREIRDFLAFLKTMVNPNDDINLLRIANVPARGLSDVTMERLLAASHERNASVFTVMRHTDVQAEFQTRTAGCIREFIHWVETTRAPLLSEETLILSTWADTLLSAIDYYGELKKGEKNAEAGESRIKNLKDLLPSLDRGEAPSAKAMERLDNFLADVALDQEREEKKENKQDAVTLITMHSCKGLEFPHVQIVGLEDGLLPHSRSKVEGTLDEERRLFYVAITRARRSLRISHCSGRKRYGQTMPCHPSPFLKELPADCIEDVDAAEARPVTAGSGTDFFAALRAVVDSE